MNTYSEADIDGVMRYMAIFHPEKANRNYCQSLLEYWEMTLQHLAINDPEAIEELIKAFERSKKD